MKPEGRFRRLAILWAAGLVLAGVALAWQIAAEVAEPLWLLRIGDWLWPRPAPLVALTAGSTGLWLYDDARPHLGKIARLQKGLVWVQADRKLVEEGFGFGCPIVVSGGSAYVSTHAETSMARQGSVVVLIKRYTMDAVDGAARFLHPKFPQAPALGVVVVRYDVYPEGVVDVTADFSQLKVAWQWAYLMNEQGAHRFTAYHDANGTTLPEGQIGPWQPVYVRQACMDEPGGLSFCVETDALTRLYYGREHRRLFNWRGGTTLSWSGIDLQFPAPVTTVHYRLTLETSSHE